jgi:hypothetical protein
MSEKQFLKSVTCNFYSSVYYASSVWLNCCKSIQRTKLASLHFRLLRTACKDFWTKIPRAELTKRCMKATPTEWANFTSASLTIKILRDRQPSRLNDILLTTYYSERRNAARGLFFDSSKTRIGAQSIQNRLMHITRIKYPWNDLNSKWSNDQIRVNLKRIYFSCNAQPSDSLKHH